MDAVLRLLTVLWRRRGMIVLSFIAFPALSLMYGLNQPPMYQAVQTLSLQKDQAQSPLLKNVGDPEYQKILYRTLTSQELARATLRDVGQLFDGASPQEERQKIEVFRHNLRLTAPSDSIIEITLRSPNQAQILRLLEATVLNFIDEIMAPERFSKEELASNLGSQLQTLKKQVADTRDQLQQAKRTIATTKASASKEPTVQDAERKVTALEFELQTLNMQKALAEKSYSDALKASQDAMFQPLLKPESNPVLTTPGPSLPYALSCLFMGFAIALGFILLSVLISLWLDTSLKNDEEIRKVLGLKILGRMPNLGDIHFENGRVSTMPRLNI